MFVGQFGMPMGGGPMGGRRRGGGRNDGGRMGRMGGAPFGPALPFGGRAPMPMGGGRMGGGRMGGGRMGGGPVRPATPFVGGAPVLQRGPVGAMPLRGRRMSMPGAMPRPKHPLVDRPWMAAAGNPVRNFDPSKFRRSPKRPSTPQPGHRSRRAQVPQRTPSPAVLQRAQSQRGRRMSMPDAIPRPNHSPVDRPWMAATGDPARNFDPAKFQRSPKRPSVPQPGQRSWRAPLPQRAPSPAVLQRAQSQHHRSDRVRFDPQAEVIGQPQHGARASQQYDKVQALKAGGMSESLAIVKGRSDGKVYVEKCIRASGHHRSRAQAELNALSLVRGHPNLNHMFEANATANGLWSIVLEYCDRGSLADRLEETARNRLPFNEASTWNVLLSVSRGLAFLHDGMKPSDTRPRHSWKAVAHLDIKPQNILISTEGGEYGERRVVLADFGCAVSIEDLEAGRVNGRRPPAGTPNWYPPEGRAGTAYGIKTDLYMLGATIHCMCQLRTSPSMTISRYESPCGIQFSKELNRAVRKLTQDNAGERPAARKVASYALDGLTGNLGRPQR